MGHRAPDLCMGETSATYVTTPIYYVNDVPHVGHAYTSVAADALARFGRLDGQPTWFATGTDEHGEKVQQSAEKRGIDPQTFCDEVSTSFREMRDPFQLSNDIFVRTTDSDHKKAVATMWNRLVDAGLIYKGVYEGWYSIRDECFYTESELVNVEGEKRAPSGSVVEWRAKEPSYFFKLSEFTQKLLDYYEANPDFIMPSTRRNEVLSWVKDGLKDLSVSRMSFSWGIGVPGDDEHVVYVWIDALTNYLTVLGWPDSETKAGDDGLYEKFWPQAVHIVGKDILRFHAVYWPAMLMGAGLPLPKRIFAHGWWTKDGQKISKSLGNVIDPFELVETYGSDATRYFLLSAASFGLDADFSRVQMLAATNGFLANALGNLLNRAATLPFKNCDKAAPARPDPASLKEKDLKLLEAARALPPKLRACYDKLQLHRACWALDDVVRLGNVYIDEEAPWVLVKSDKERFCIVCWVLLETLRIVGMGYAPIMPEASRKLLLQIGVDESIAAMPRLDMMLDDAYVIDGNPIPKPYILFPKIDEKELEAADAAKAAAAAAAAPENDVDAAEVQKLVEDIKAAGEAVRDAKAAGTDKDALKPLIEKLLSSKHEYEKITGKPYDPPKQKKGKR